MLRVGAGVTYTRAIAELGDRLPGLAEASRTVGSPQIRNRGTIGGNLGSSSPAGDALPPLYASGAEIEMAAPARHAHACRSTTSSPARSATRSSRRRADRRVPRAARAGPQQFAKIGTRNAMVIAVCSFALALAPGAAAGRHVHRLRGAHAAARARGGGVRGRGARLGRRRAAPDDATLRASASWWPGGREPDRRRPRQRRLPPPRAVGAGAPHAAWAWSEQCA